MTGIQKLSPELAAKRLELLKQIMPLLTRVAVLWNPAYSKLNADWLALRSAAKDLNITLVAFEAQAVEDYEPAFSAMASQHMEAVFMFTDVLGYLNAPVLADLAAKYRLPAIYPFRETTLVGGLMSYGPNMASIWHRSAYYVDKLLTGTPAADLPIEQPSTFELVLNLKTAKTLGLTLPQSVLLRADEVIR